MRISIHALRGDRKIPDELDTATSSSAAYSFIRQELDLYEPQQTFENAKKIFNLETFQCLFWNRTGKRIQTYKYHDSGLIEDANILKPNKVIAFHTLSKTNSEKVKLFIRNYGQSSPHELMIEILNALDDGIGSLVLLGERK